MDMYPRMLFRYPAALPSPAALQDGIYDTLVVDDAEAEAAADGFHQTPAEARAATAPAPVDPDNAPPTRAELEAKATELGIPFKGTWRDKKIADAIAEKLQG